MTANPADAVREALTRFRFYEGYAWDGGADVGSMQEEPDGDYVLYDEHTRIVAELEARLAALAGAAPEPMAWTLIERVRSCGLRRHMTQAMYDANPALHKWYEPFNCANCTPHAPAKAREVSEVDVERALTMFDAECWRHELSPMGALDRVGAMRAALATFAEGAE